MNIGYVRVYRRVILMWKPRYVTSVYVKGIFIMHTVFTYKDIKLSSLSWVYSTTNSTMKYVGYASWLQRLHRINLITNRFDTWGLQ